MEPLELKNMSDKKNSQYRVTSMLYTAKGTINFEFVTTKNSHMKTT
jgi:hypothetical protein